MKYLVIYLTITIIFLFISPSAYPVAAFSTGAKAEIKARLESRTDIRIYGYTAAFSIVQASGIRTFAQVYSDRTGYFMINTLPVAREAKDICLTTIDSEKRSAFPLCIDLPDNNLPSEIGPLLLSPTISISKGRMLQKETASAHGYAIPDANIVVSFFEVPRSSVMTHISSSLAKLAIPVAEAADLPLVTAKTDKRGAFSINLPTEKAMGYRIFAKAFYNDSPSPKSHTLAFIIDPYLGFWIKYILPKILFILLFLIFIDILIVFEIRTKKGRVWYAYFNETKLKPFGVRRRLQLRRIWYNFQEYWKSHQK